VFEVIKDFTNEQGLTWEYSAFWSWSRTG